MQASTSTELKKLNTGVKDLRYLSKKGTKEKNKNKKNNEKG